MVRPPLTALLALLVCLVACADDEVPDNTIDDDGIVVTDGASLADAAVAWESASWSSAWIDFAGRTTVMVEHPLGRDPLVILPYLSFEQEGEERDVTLASGDKATIIVGCPDDFDAGRHCVSLENRTSADFYLRLVLQ